MLSDAGRELYPALVALMQWGDRHLAGPEGAPLLLRHRNCGELAEPVLVCSVCHEPIDARDIEPELGPGAHAARTRASRVERARTAPAGARRGRVSDGR